MLHILSLERLHNILYKLINISNFISNLFSQNKKLILFKRIINKKRKKIQTHINSLDI